MSDELQKWVYLINHASVVRNENSSVYCKYCRNLYDKLSSIAQIVNSSLS